jgi:3-hydroxybutyryl-CoA dehydrogenase
MQTILVIGAGTMGRGIAQIAAASGFDVRLHDTTPDLVRRGLDAIAATLDEGIARGKVTAEAKAKTLERIVGGSDLVAGALDVDAAIEAVPESLELKLEIFSALGRLAPQTALLASNTSSLPIGRIAEAATLPSRVVGLHFFNPVHLMPLVEVVRAETTSEESVARAVTLGRALGKEPIVVRDAPGFASSRLGLALGLEAMRMLEQGVASAEDIDKAMTLGYRHPMGPLRLTDLVGLDVRLAIAEHLERELGSEAFRPPAILRRLVAEGRLGKKTGRGFYEW